MTREHRIVNEVLPRLAALHGLWFCGAGLFVVGVLQVVLRAAVGEPFDWVGAALGGVQMACGLAQAIVAWWELRGWHLGAIVLTPKGIASRGGGRPRTIPWSEVVDVQPLRQRRVWTVRVVLASGRTCRLPAPKASVTRWNPRFVEHLNAIRAWWQWYRNA